jgi:uncharacterized protein
MADIRRVFVIRPLALVCLGILCVLLTSHSLLGQPRFPQLSGRVVDEAGLLSPSDRATLTEELRALEEQTTDQLVVYTTKSLQGYPIEEFGYQLGRTWQIGQKDKNNGVLLIVAPNERQVRIEVGYGLEPRLTDATCKLIIENAILPAFRRGDFAGGIKAGVRDIRAVLLGDSPSVRTPTIQESPSEDLSPLLYMLLIWTALWLFVLWHDNYRRHRRHQTGYQSGWEDNVDRKENSGDSFFSWGGGGGFSGGGGGGFSGGGGSFGGGGASGRW